MNPTTRARIQNRTAANYRLQALTIGAAALGVAGTGLFSYAAAMTYTGKPAAAVVDDQGSDQGVDPTSGQTATGNAQNPTPQTQRNGNVNQAPTATAVPRVRSSRHARVSTGGS